MHLLYSIECYSKKSTNVEVFNLEGQRVAVETGNVNRISVSGLANGMYILKVTANDGVHTYKVSKR